jgi:hydroxymethylpyrimidine pyrophosphatase-like HAD family hydrolase
MTIKIFVSDLDGTLLGDEKSARQFKQVWEQLEETERPFLCYNTGRLLDDVQQLIQNGRLPSPDYIISGVGTSVYDYRSTAVLKEFTEILDEGWDLDLVEQTVHQLPLPITKQPQH